MHAAVRRARRRSAPALLALVILAVPAAVPATATAALNAPTLGTPASAGGAATATSPGSSLESAASKAGTTGRQVAMSLIGLGFAVAAIVLSFRRDFKEAAGVFAVGLVAILLATPAGVSLLQDTVTSLFGSQ
jgi:hypothetical protein